MTNRRAAASHKLDLKGAHDREKGSVVAYAARGRKAKKGGEGYIKAFLRSPTLLFSRCLPPVSRRTGVVFLSTERLPDLRDIRSSRSRPPSRSAAPTRSPSHSSVVLAYSSRRLVKKIKREKIIMSTRIHPRNAR